MDTKQIAVCSYCMLCRTGAEKSVANNITKRYPGWIAIAPVKIQQVKRQGQWVNDEVILLPGYIFLYSDDDLPINLRSHVNHLYRALEYGKGLRRLTGTDAEYAAWIYRHQGAIGSSKVIAEEGQAIQVIDGPLLDCQGTIIKLDKHKRRAMVEFSFDGQKRVVSISVECVLPMESGK